MVQCQSPANNSNKRSEDNMEQLCNTNTMETIFKHNRTMTKSLLFVNNTNKRIEDNMGQLCNTITIRPVFKPNRTMVNS